MLVIVLLLLKINAAGVLVNSLTWTSLLQGASPSSWQIVHHMKNAGQTVAFHKCHIKKLCCRICSWCWLQHLPWSVPFGLSEVRNSSPHKLSFVKDLRLFRWCCAKAPYLACLPQLTTSPGHNVPRLLSEKCLLLQGLAEQWDLLGHRRCKWSFCGTQQAG